MKTNEEVFAEVSSYMARAEFEFYSDVTEDFCNAICNAFREAIKQQPMTESQIWDLFIADRPTITVVRKVEEFHDIGVEK